MAEKNNQILIVGGARYTMVAADDGSVEVVRIPKPPKPTG